MSTDKHEPSQLLKILLADDHALFRAGLLHVLRQLESDVQIIEAGTCKEALDAAATHPDLSLLLLDLQMPDGHGLTALETVAQRHITLPVVVLSASERREDMQRALDAGALGFIPKSVTPAVMISALRLVLAGGVYIPPQMIQSTPTGRSEGMTPRQLDVLAHVIDGKPNKLIATELGLTESTVKAHITAVFRALQVTNRTQAARAVEKLALKLPVI